MESINTSLMERERHQQNIDGMHHKLMMELKNGIKDLMEISEMKGGYECRRY